MNQEKNDKENVKESKLKKIVQALSRKTDKPTVNPMICETLPLILNLKPQGNNSACVIKRICASN